MSISASITETTAAGSCLHMRPVAMQTAACLTDNCPTTQKRGIPLRMSRLGYWQRRVCRRKSAVSRGIAFLAGVWR